MEMTIDEAIEYNEYLKTYMEINDKKGTHKFLEENYIALDMAIDTMQKYEKVKQALQDLKKEMEEIITNKQSFIYHLVIDTIERKIREVDKK